MEDDCGELEPREPESKKFLFKFHSTEGTSDLTPSPWIYWGYYSLRYIIYVLYQMCPEQPSNAGLLFSITPQLLDMTNIGSYWRLYCIDWSINYYIYTHMHRIYIYTSHRYSHHRTRGRTIKNATRIVQVATPPPKIRRKRWNSRGLVQLQTAGIPLGNSLDPSVSVPTLLGVWLTQRRWDHGAAKKVHTGWGNIP